MSSRIKKLNKAKQAQLKRDRAKTVWATKASASQILSVVSETFNLKDVRYSTQVFTSSELSDVDQANIWDMLEHNMQHMCANSSLGWDPPSKKEELFHRDSRFILLRQSQAQEGLEQPIMAYSMFRFEIENNECVLYCYELQVLQSMQRGGLGKTLMGCVYDIASQWNMKKVVLTVFKDNEAAFALYKALGFEVEEEGVDYSIMSKLIVDAE